MTAITIQGYKFEVPPAVIDPIVVGYTLADEGEAHALRQTKLENLRNNFAAAVKKEMNGGDTLTPEAEAKLHAAFTEYATQYRFGVRTAGEPRARLDPLTKEMLNLAKADFVNAYFAKYKEKPTKENAAEMAEALMNRRHDDYAKRARAIIRQRESAATDTLESLGM